MMTTSRFLLAVGATAAVAVCWRGALEGQTKTTAPHAQLQVVETTIPKLSAAMDAGRVTSRQLVTLYLARMGMYEDKLHHHREPARAGGSGRARPGARAGPDSRTAARHPNRAEG